MKHFLIPTDFSEAGQFAEEYALELALLTKAKCTFVNAYEMPHVFTAEMENRVVAYGNRAKEKLQKRIGVLRDHPRYGKLQLEMLVEEGSPEKIIPRLAEEKGVDLVVIGLSKHDTFDEFLSGNIGAEVVENSRVPVLAIPKGQTFKAPKEFIYAAEYREEDLQNLEELSQWAKLFSARLRVVHVEEEEKQDRKLRFRGFSEDVEDRLSYPYLVQDLYVAEDVEKGILEAVAGREGLILSMAHYHKSFLQRIFGHSHTKAIAKKAQVPLLVFYEEE